jgi:hypothetical protein
MLSSDRADRVPLQGPRGHLDDTGPWQPKCWSGRPPFHGGSLPMGIYEAAAGGRSLRHDHNTSIVIIPATPISRRREAAAWKGSGPTN